MIVNARQREVGGCRWQPRPLLFVLPAMTWCLGDSIPERFETAKAFYVASNQRRRRPGKTFQGFQMALAKLPMPVVRVVASAVRRRLAQVFAGRWRVDGFIPLGCDGSRLTCPRSAELEQRLSGDNQDHSPPTIWVTALVHLPSGLLWGETHLGVWAKGPPVNEIIYATCRRRCRLPPCW